MPLSKSKSIPSNVGANTRASPYNTVGNSVALVAQAALVALVALVAQVQEYSRLSFISKIHICSLIILYGMTFSQVVCVEWKSKTFL